MSMLTESGNQTPAAGVTVFGTGRGDSGHCLEPFSLIRPFGNFLQKTPRLIGDLEFIADNLPLDANEPIKMHALGLEPDFQIFP